MSRRACPEHAHARIDEDGSSLPVCLGERGSEPHPIARWDVRADDTGEVIGWGHSEEGSLLRGSAEERIERVPHKRRPKPKKVEARDAGVLGESR